MELLYRMRLPRHTRCARRAARESDGIDDPVTQGSPRGLGQPWAEFRDTFSVVVMARYARRKIAAEFEIFEMA